MSEDKNQSAKATRIYSRERLEKVTCITCSNVYQIKVIEHETNINANVNKYQTLYDIFCHQCGTPYVGIDII